MSYNSLVAAAVEHFALQDDNSNSEILDSANGINGTLTSGNTTDASVSGPTAWLQKAIRLNGTTDHITFVDLPTALNNKSEWTISVWWKSTDTAAREKTIYSVGGSATLRMSRVSPGFNKLTPVFIHGRVVQNGSQTTESFTTPVDTATWRHQSWVKRVGSNIEIFEDGVSVGTLGSDVPIWDGITKHGIGIDIHAAINPWPGDLADLVVADVEYSSADVDELIAGPEPVNTVAPTLSIDGSGNWTGSVGTWALPAPFAAGSNGTITYTWQLRLDSDDSVVSSGSGSSPSGSGLSAATDYYLHVVAANDGDDDLPAESTRESYVGGSGVTATPAVSSLIITEFAPTVTSPRSLLPDTATLTISTFAPAVSTPVVSTPSPATLSLSAFAPDVSAPRTVVPPALSLMLSTFEPSVTADASHTVVVPRASLSISTFAPTVEAVAAVAIEPGTTSLNIVSFAPTVIAPQVATPSTASLNVSAFAPSVSTPVVVTPELLSLVTARFAPTVVNPVVLSPGMASLTITGHAPSLSDAANDNIFQYYYYHLMG